jgi:hypothetical protein
VAAAAFAGVAAASGWRRNCATIRITTPWKMPVAMNAVL